MCFFQYLQANLFPCISSIASVAAAFFIGLSWRASKKTWKTAERTFQYQMFINMQKDYRDKDMGRAVQSLWGLYNDSKQKLDSLQILYNCSSDHHSHRRIVSHFYQRLGWLYTTEILDIELILSYWTEGDLRIIPKILIPIETIILPEKLGGKQIEPQDYPKPFQNMIKLYEEAKKESSSN